MVDDIISIKSADVVFAVGTSGTIPPDDNGWKTLFSELILTTDGYVWTCTKIVKTDNSVEYSGKHCLGKCSDFADVIELYALGDNNVTPPDSGWKQSYSPVKGKWLWTKNELHFQNSSQVMTTEPICIGYFAKDGNDGTSFNLRGTAIAHYSSFSELKKAGSFQSGDYYLLDKSSDADNTANDSYNEPCIAVYMEAPDYDWYIYSANIGDAYRVETDLWVCTKNRWVNMGSIQGPQGEEGKGAMWALLSKNQVTFESDSDGMVVAETKSLGLRVVVGSTIIPPSERNISVGTCENFDSSKVSIKNNGLTTSIAIDSSGISSKKVADNFYMTCPYSSVKLSVKYKDYSLIVSINITVDTSVQDGYFHTSIEGLEARYTTIKDGVTKNEGLIRANSESIQLANSKITAVNDRLTTYEAAGIVTESNYAGLYAEYQENGKIVSKAEMSTAIEDGISKATINAEQVNINADHMLNITGDYMTVDATNFKLDKSGNVSVKGNIEATSGSIGNLKITDQLYSNDAGKGSVKITPTSVQINGAGDGWANGSSISFNASGISSFAEFYSISPNPTVTIGNGFTNGYGGGPTLKLDAYFAFSPSLILGGFIHGFSRGTCYFGDSDPIITKGERITGDMKDSNGEYLGSCFVYGGAGDKTIYLEGSGTYAGDELIIMNESARPITIKIKSNYVSTSMNVMWVNGNSAKVSEYTLRAGGVVHGIYTGDYWHLW